MDDDVLEYINLQAYTSTVVDNLSTLFHNLEYLIKDEGISRQSEEEYWDEEEEEEDDGGFAAECTKKL